MAEPADQAELTKKLVSLITKGLAVQGAAGLATKFDPDVLIATAKSQSAIKGDIRFNIEEDIAQSFGDANTAIDGVSSRLFKLQNELYDTNYLHTAKLGNLEMTRFFEDEKDIYAKFLGVIDNNNSLMTHFTEGVNADSAARVSLLGDALGYDSEQMQSFLVRQHAITGKVDTELLKRTLAYSRAIEAKTGISSKIIAENISVMMKDVSTFGAMTDKEMARASAAITKVGLSMNTVTSMVKNFNSFEDAAGNVAKLTQALGVQLDVYDVVEMANSGSTTELIRTLQDSFDAANIDITNMTLPMKRVVSEIVANGDINEMEKMFGAASSGLDDFLDIADSALDNVDQNNIDESLEQANKNIRQLHISKGEMESAYKASMAKLTSSLSTALSGTALQLKRSIDDAVHLTNSSLAYSIEHGIMKDVIANVKSEMQELSDVVLNSLKKLSQALRNNNIEALAKWAASDQIAEQAAKVQAEESQKSRTEARAWENKTRVNRAAAAATSMPITHADAVNSGQTITLDSAADVKNFETIVRSRDQNLKKRGTQTAESDPGSSALLTKAIVDLTNIVKKNGSTDMKIFYDASGQLNITKADGSTVVWTTTE